MKKPNFLTLIVVGMLFAVMLAGCVTAPDSKPQTEESAPVKTVEITDIYGTVTVPINPKNVVALDNRTFETLSDWGIELAAVPKSIMPADSPYVSNTSVFDIGSHNDPNLEIIAAVDPELVIVGQRFASRYRIRRRDWLFRASFGTSLGPDV